MLKELIAATALLVGSSVAAASQPGNFYLGTDIGLTRVDDTSGHDTSFGLFSGYSFHQHFAVEAGYRRLNRSDHGESDFRVKQASLALIGSLPVSARLRIYGRLGANRLESRISVNGYRDKYSTTKAVVGIGAAYAIADAISVRIEAQRPDSDTTNLSLGLSFGF